MLKITSDLKGQMLWVGADETIDERFVLNIMVGKLVNDYYSPPHLVNLIFLEKTNVEHVSRAINETITKLLPDTERSDVVLLLSDAAA